MLQRAVDLYHAHPVVSLLVTLTAALAFLVRRLWARRSGEGNESLAEALVGLFSGPILLLFFFTLLSFIVPGWRQLLSSFAVLGFCLVVGWFVAKVGQAYLSHRYVGERRSHPQAVPGLLHGVITGTCLLIGLGVFFWVQGYSLTGVWISTGLATALLGFALQQTLGDFFSGVALSLEGAFRVGDWLRLDDGTEGQIIDINWRATWLHGWDNTTYVIPNARLASQGFKNLHGQHHRYRPWYFVKIPAEVDPRLAKELLLEAVYNCKHNLKYPAPVVRLTDASTLPYTYMVWVHFANYPAMFRGREELYREIHYVLARAGVTPAVNVQEWRTRRAEIPTAEPSTIQLALKSLDIFSSLSDKEIDDIALASHQLHFDAGSTILLEGDSSDALDIITSGLVESRIKLPNGEKMVGNELVAGQYFGLISMFTEHPSLFEYIAGTDVTLIRVDMSCMQEVLRNHPDLADYYASIIKQRLDEAEMLQIADSQSDSKPTSLGDIRRFIKRLIRKNHP
ncbi:MAG: mechanosensitive ion channel protein MscS [Desulfobulbaceae bacterium]|nr:MAG: mechanosensitive ion channel protein MscS [Desulfobulbaceae bacterium]